MLIYEVQSTLIPALTLCFSEKLLNLEVMRHQMSDPQMLHPSFYREHQVQEGASYSSSFREVKPVESRVYLGAECGACAAARVV